MAILRDRARAALWLWGLLWAAIPPGAQPAISEYQIKAAFLYNFAKFVEWPDSGSGGPIVICVVGRDPFGTVLEQTVQGKMINGRALLVRRTAEQEPPKPCHVLFIGGVDSGRLGPLLRRSEQASELTVGESPSFAQAGGMIGFVVEDNKVRFEVNLDAARRGRVRISSRLLKLARSVRGQPTRSG